MPLDHAIAVKELDAVLADYNTPESQKLRFQNMTSDGEHARVISRFVAAIERWAPPGSTYRRSVDALRSHSTEEARLAAERLAGVLKALRDDLAAGYTRSVEDVIHGELFSDYLEMGEHLMNEGYKDAGAVIIGSTLESHLRQLCAKYGVSVTFTPPGKTDAKPKMASTINVDLKAARAYTLTDQKAVEGWLDIRNNAAHGHYDKVIKEQVAIMLSGIREFIARCPA